MNKSKMIELEKEITCSNKHNNEPVISLMLDERLKPEQQLMCQICIQELDSTPNVMSFKKFKGIIQEQQDTLYTSLQQVLTRVIDKITLFNQCIVNLQTNITNRFEELLKNIDNWLDRLQKIEKEKSQYILLEQLSTLDQSIEEKRIAQIKDIYKINQEFFEKLIIIFQENTIIDEFQQCHQLLHDTQCINDKQVNHDKESIKIFKYGYNDTPKIIKTCSKHNSEIIYIDISKGIKKEERAKCVDCERTNTITVSQFKILWDQYHAQKKQGLRDCQMKQKIRILQVKQSLTSFATLQKTCIQELQNLIDKSLLCDSSSLPEQNFSDSCDPVLEMAEELSQAEENKKTQAQLTLEEEQQCVNQNVSKQLQELIDSLQNTYKTINQQFTEDLSQRGNPKQQSESIKVDESITCYNKISYELTDDKVKQQEYCDAVAFNKEGSIMVAGCDFKIKVWRLENGQLKEQLRLLEGHTDYVFCLVFSKKTKWFASGSRDYSIRCWKDMGNNEWKSSQPQKVHTNSVVCILLNQNEDQLISCSSDNSIKIWGIDQYNNEITYEYSLDKHSSTIWCISLNESETTLVSSGYDKQILIWGRGENRKWEYKYLITKSADDYGYSVCFINDNMIAWQQYSLGFTHFFKLENNKFIEKPELKIELKQVGSDGDCFFPSVSNKQKQVLIQKHNLYVYIIRFSNDGKQFNIQQEPIDCDHPWNYGGLTADGQHLVIWNFETKQFRVYILKYE